MVKLLLDKGAGVEIKRPKDGATALLIASQQGHAAMVKLLLDHGADMKTKVTVNRVDWTPLKVAKKMKRTEIAAVLAKAGGS